MEITFSMKDKELLKKLEMIMLMITENKSLLMNLIALKEDF